MRWLFLLVLLFSGWLGSTQLASSGWFWNAQLDVEGTTTRIAWTVNDPNASSYRADMWVYVPEGAEASVVELLSEKEKVHIRTDSSLACTSSGVEVRAVVRVKPNGAVKGRDVGVALLADGVVVDSATGKVTERIEVSGTLPADNPSCAGS
ncbi:MAG: hypothetical protein HYX99_02300 [Chloroflexi bacterium]|nr:hypothetical protein [Chloroflexota bacterium]